MPNEIITVGTRGLPEPDGAWQAEGEVTLRDLAGVVYARRWLILAITAATILLAFIVTTLQQPQYDGEATIRLYEEQSPASRFGSDLGALTGLPGLGRAGSGIETDVWVVQSRRILAQVVDSLSLQVRLNDPHVPRSEVFSRIDVESEPTPATISLERRDDGGYAVALEPANPEQSVPHPESMQPGTPARIAGVALTLSPAVEAEEIEFQIRSTQRTIESVQGSLQVEQLGRSSDILSVKYRAPDAELAAAVPNAIADAFMEYKLETTQSDAQRRASFLRDQVARYSDELAAAEERLREFREREHIISVEDQAAAQVRRMAELQVRHDELISERNALDGLLSRLADASGTAGSERYRSLAAFPVFFGNQTIQAMLASLIELENQRAELAVLRTPSSIDIQGIDARITELEEQLLSTVQSYRTSLESQLASTTRALNEFTSRVGTVPAREVEFARLMRQQQLLTEIHSQLSLTLRETEVEEAVEPVQIELLDPAVEPLRASAPRPVLNLFIGGVLGMMLALAVVFVRQAADTRVYSRRDVALASGGLAVIGTIPHVNGRSWLDARRRFQLSSVRRISRGAEEESKSLVLRDAPRTAAAEAFRGLRTQLTSRAAAGDPTTLVVTSAAEGEGKSTTAANLAITFAQQGLRTLLCDCDLRKGKVHEMLGVRQSPGVADILLGRASADDAIQQITLDGAALDVLPAGALPPHPAELLGSGGMGSLLHTLSQQYAHIIIDTPPLGLATDAAVIATLPGAGAILVTRAGHTDRRSVEQIAAEFRSLGTRVVGVIINDVQEQGVLYSAGTQG